jgi:CelD/BcsL family acetyltransferase involved in cellulose biosynthesis
MKVELVSCRELDTRHTVPWRNWQRLTPGLDSPFVGPEFAATVSQVRPHVRVAVLHDAQAQPAGYLAFERHGRNARPLAAGLAEWEGVVARPDLAWDGRELLRALKLRSLAFEHVPTGQEGLSRFAHRHGQSPCAYLRGDFDGYRRQQLQQSSTAVQIERKRRKLEREQGSLRFELFADVSLVLDCLQRWKRLQHERTGVMDVFRFSWVAELLRGLAGTNYGPDFAALPSMLFAGERPIAVHFGLCSRNVAHVWFPAYDEQFSRYSPGLILFWEQFSALAQRGIERVDFGPSPQRYKPSLANGCLPVSLGTVYEDPVVQRAQAVLRAARSRMPSGLLGRTLRIPAHMLFRFRQWRAFR